MELSTTETTTEVLPGRVATDVRFDRVRVELSGGPGGIEGTFDTGDPAPTGEAADSLFARRMAPYRRMAGGTVTILQRPSGQILEIEGMEAFRDRLLEGVAADDPQRRAVEGLASFPVLVQTLAPNLMVPSGSTAVGSVAKAVDARSMPETVGVPGILFYSGDHRLAEVKDGKARVEIRGEVSLDAYPGMMPPPAHLTAYRSRLRLDRGVFRGWARIALDKGVLEEDEHTTEVDLVYLKPDGSGEVPMPTRLVRSTKLVK